MAIRIAYQGIKGSNSDNACQEMTKKLNNSEFFNNLNNNFKFVEGVTSQGVVDALIQNKADYGVVAIKNVLAGEVIETREAFRTLNFEYEILSEEKFEIHHCAFIKNKSCESKITKIASHIHALLQCRKYIDTIKTATEDTITEVELTDTAIGAKYLANGTLTEDTAILCRKDAGEMFGLTLIAENIEDISGNYTTFVFIKKIN